MSEQLTGARVQPQLPSWRVLRHRVHATFETGDFNTGTRFVSEIARLADAADHHPDVTLRYPAVAVQIFSHDIGGLSSRDVNLARQISELAEKMGIEVNTAAPQFTEICVDAMDIAAVKPFWRELLGYTDDDEIALTDPRGLGTPVWFQQMDEPRTQRNRIHFDVWVPHDIAEARIAAAIAAGGRLLADDEAPAFWVLADPEGNEACICTWQGRDQ